MFEDGKPQKVDMFSYVEIPVERQSRYVFADRAVTVDTHSNRQPFAGRLYVIVLDDQTSASMRTSQVKKSAKEFVQQYMGDNDIAAVIHTSGRTDAAQEFTSNKQLLYTAIDKFVGRRMRSLHDRAARHVLPATSHAVEDNASTDDGNSQTPASTDPGGHGRLDPSDFERGYRAIGVLDTLKIHGGVPRRASAGGGRPCSSSAKGSTIRLTTRSAARCASDVIRATQDAITMAARANVNYYTIDPRGLVGMTQRVHGDAGRWIARDGRRSGDAARPARMHASLAHGRRVQRPVRADERADALQGSLRELAEKTGGIASVNTNSLTTAFERIVQANSRYYVLGYYPPTHPRDGRFHKIEVKVNRPGLRVDGPPRICVASRQKPPKNASATKKPGARAKPDAQRRQDLEPAARRAEQPDAAERPQLHGAGGAVQEHGKRSVGGARDRARRQSAAVSAAE